MIQRLVHFSLPSVPGYKDKRIILLFVVMYITDLSPTAKGAAVSRTTTIVNLIIYAHRYRKWNMQNEIVHHRIVPNLLLWSQSKMLVRNTYCSVVSPLITMAGADGTKQLAVQTIFFPLANIVIFFFPFFPVLVSSHKLVTCEYFIKRRWTL